jgi:hypothetical protein
MLNGYLAGSQGIALLGLTPALCACYESLTGSLNALLVRQPARELIGPVDQTLT